MHSCRDPKALFSKQVVMVLFKMWAIILPGLCRLSVIQLTISKICRQSPRTKVIFPIMATSFQPTRGSTKMLSASGLSQTNLWPISKESISATLVCSLLEPSSLCYWCKRRSPLPFSYKVVVKVRNYRHFLSLYSSALVVLFIQALSLSPSTNSLAPRLRGGRLPKLTNRCAKRPVPLFQGKSSRFLSPDENAGPPFS